MIQGEGALDLFFDYSRVAKASVAAFPDWRAWVVGQLTDPVPRTAGRLKTDFAGWCGGLGPGPERLDLLRRFKRREMLRIGARDFCGAGPLQESFAELSQLAVLCIEEVAAVASLETEGRLGKNPEPFIVLGLGKLGGWELNYSSDIDVMFVYGEEGELAGGRTVHEWYEQWGRRVGAAFNAKTGEGQLFRMDLRLRPDGDAGPLARSLESCEHYYFSCGETWERMAMMKARSVCGDAELAYLFGAMLQPFCYSKNLIQESLREVAEIKERMETELLDPKTLRRDVKRGPGCIREIEFIVQFLQLLHGARHAYLQHTSTLQSLDALVRAQLLDRQTVAALRDAYFFWRRVEHRIQMRDEAQTHLLPEPGPGYEELARTLGYPGADALEAEAERHRATVGEWFHRVVREPCEQEGAPADVWADFPEDIRRAVRQMKGSGNQFNLSRRTKNAFRRLEPILAAELRGLVSPEEALVGVVNFSERYGSVGHLYETWATQPQVLKLLLKLFDASVKFRDLLVARPEWMEDICRGGELDKTFGFADYAAQAAGYGDLDELRLWRWEQGMRIAIRDSLGLVSAADREQEHSSLADAVVRRVAELSGAEGLVVVAGGKFGGWELSFGSDLDLVFLEGSPDQARALLGAITKPTAAGTFFPADIRLRPEGESGELTLPCEAALAYYRGRAQTWEFMAATKFRCVCGPAEHSGFFGELARLWREYGQRPGTLEEIRQMRALIEKSRDKDVPDPLKIKTGAGGVVDVEFAVQAWQMCRGKPETRTRAALALLAAEFPGEAAVLAEGYEKLREVESVMRRHNFTGASKLPSDPAAQDRVARRAGYPDGWIMLAELGELRKQVRASYESVMRGLQR